MKKTLNIGFIVSHFPALSESFVLNQITGMIDLGHNVEIFAMLNPKEPKCHGDIEKYRLMERVHYFEAIPGGRKESIAKAFRLYGKYIVKDPVLLIKSLFIFKKYKYCELIGRYYFSLPFLGKRFDVVLCHFGPNGNIAAYLRQSGFGMKLVTMFHGYDIRLFERLGEGIYGPIIKYGDCFLAISSYNHKNMLDMGIDPEKIRYHPVGIDVKKYSFRERAGSPAQKNKVTFITVARLVEEKGLSNAIEAMRKIVDRYPGVSIEYRIVGDGPLREGLNQLVGRLGLGNHVRFLGAMDQEDVIENLAESDVFLLSSVAEALPVVLMEAQAVGLPVVATGVGSVSEIVRDKISGRIVPAGDVEAMESGIEYMMENAERWPAMGRAGRANVESKYDIGALNRRLEGIYRGLIGDDACSVA